MVRHGPTNTTSPKSVAYCKCLVQQCNSIRMAGQREFQRAVAARRIAPGFGYCDLMNACIIGYGSSYFLVLAPACHLRAAVVSSRPAIKEEQHARASLSR